MVYIYPSVLCKYAFYIKALSQRLIIILRFHSKSLNMADEALLDLTPAYLPASSPWSPPSSPAPLSHTVSTANSQCSRCYTFSQLLAVPYAVPYYWNFLTFFSYPILYLVNSQPLAISLNALLPDPVLLLARHSHRYVLELLT